MNANLMTLNGMDIVFSLVGLTIFLFIITKLLQSVPYYNQDKTKNLLLIIIFIDIMISIGILVTDFKSEKIIFTGKFIIDFFIFTFFNFRMNANLPEIIFLILPLISFFIGIIAIKKQYIKTGYFIIFLNILILNIYIFKLYRDFNIILTKNDVHFINQSYK